MIGQNRLSITVVPISITSEGSSAIRMTSLRLSSAHMPRVILRTVEPAKELACQSDEKRCTRWKAFWAMSLIMRRVRAMMVWKASWRTSTEAAPSATMTKKAVIAPFQAISLVAAPLATASTSRPAKNGVRMSATVSMKNSPMMRATRRGCRRQCPAAKPSTLP